MKNTLLIIACFALVASGCKKDSTEEVDLGLGYFPNKIGSWIEYHIDSIGRDDGTNLHDTVSYNIREKVMEAYVDPAGRTAYRIHRLVLNTDSQWVVRDVWTRTSDNRYAEVTEENVRRLKMSFPVRSGRTWNYNVYNSEGEFELTYDAIGDSYTLNGITYPKTVRVQSTLEPNFVTTDLLDDRYADGIGLIYHRRDTTDTQWHYFEGQNPPPPVLWTKGVYFTMQAVAYGN